MHGDEAHKLMVRLKSLQRPLLTMNKSEFPDILLQLDEAREALLAVQERMTADQWNVGLVEQEVVLRQEYHRLMRAAHDYKVQLSKATWLCEGDQNTRYFHSLMRQQRYHRVIRMVHNEVGDILEDPVAIQDHFVKFYT